MPVIENLLLSVVPLGGECARADALPTLATTKWIFPARNDSAISEAVNTQSSFSLAAP